MFQHDPKAREEKQNQEREERKSKALLGVFSLLIILLLLILVVNYKAPIPKALYESSDEPNYELVNAQGQPYENWRIKNLPVRDAKYYTTCSGNDIKLRILSVWNPKLIIDLPNLRRWEMTYHSEAYQVDNAYWYEEIGLQESPTNPSDFYGWVESQTYMLSQDGSEVEVKQFYNLPYYCFALVVDHTKNMVHYYIGAAEHNYAYHIFYESGNSTAEISVVLNDILSQLTGINEQQAAQALHIDPLYDYNTLTMNTKGNLEPMCWFEITSPAKYYLTFSSTASVGVIRLVSGEYGDYSEIFNPKDSAITTYTLLANQGDRFIFYGLSDDIEVQAQCISSFEDVPLQLEPISVYGFVGGKPNGYRYKTIEKDQEKLRNQIVSYNKVYKEYEDMLNSLENTEASPEAADSIDVISDNSIDEEDNSLEDSSE